MEQKKINKIEQKWGNSEHQIRNLFVHDTDPGFDKPSRFSKPGKQKKAEIAGFQPFWLLR